MFLCSPPHTYTQPNTKNAPPPALPSPPSLPRPPPPAPLSPNVVPGGGRVRLPCVSTSSVLRQMRRPNVSLMHCMICLGCTQERQHMYVGGCEGVRGGGKVSGGDHRLMQRQEWSGFQLNMCTQSRPKPPIAVNSCCPAQFCRPSAPVPSTVSLIPPAPPPRPLFCQLVYSSSSVCSSSSYTVPSLTRLSSGSTL